MAFRTCCCGCPVKTGALIIGYFYAISSGIAAVILMLTMFVVEEKTATIPPPTEEDAEHRRRYEIFLIVEGVAAKALLLGAIVCMKSLAVSALLIHGVKWTKPAFVLPWIIFFGAGMVFQILLFTSLPLVLATVISVGAWYTLVASGMFSFCMQMYFLVVVCSHYHRMKKSSLIDEEEMM